VTKLNFVDNQESEVEYLTASVLKLQSIIVTLSVK